jgi:hypothetical protein
MQANSRIDFKIPTFLINLKTRLDRLSHVKVQFSDKPEFDLTVFEAITHHKGAVGLWFSTVEIIKQAQSTALPYVLICEDDILFTQSYKKEQFYSNIRQAQKLNADVLLGGVHWYNSAIDVTDDLYWVDIFTATHFMVVFENFYDAILNTSFEFTDISDLKISEMTDKKFVIHPFIAVQKEFGYSDISPSHDKAGVINTGFKAASSVLNQITNIGKYYRGLELAAVDPTNFVDISIPTYIFRTNSDIDAHAFTYNQFNGRPEFDIQTVVPRLTDEAAIPRDQYIKIFEDAIAADHDVFIICQDDHRFTPHYLPKLLFELIYEAFQQGADILSGGTSDCGIAVPISARRIWVNQMLSTQFLIFFKSFFDIALSALQECTDMQPGALVQLTHQKMVIFPPISENIETHPSSDGQHLEEMEPLINFISSRNTRRLEKVSESYRRYHRSN